MARKWASEVTSGIRNSALGILGVAGIEEMGRRTAEFGEELVNTSKRLGVTIEQLQVLRELARENGTSLDGIAKAFENIDIARAKALGSGKDAQAARKAFSMLGVSDADLRQQTAAQLFLGPMHNAAMGSSPEDLAPYLKELMGRPFREMMGALTDDSARLEKKMREMGMIMDTETAVHLKNLADEAKLLSNIIVSNLGPSMVKLAEFIYTTVLKGGKGLAGASASAGAGTATMSGWQTAKMLPQMLAWGASDLFHRAFMGRTAEESRQYIQGKMAGAGFNVKAAQEAAAGAAKPWQGKLDEFAEMMKRLKEESERLKHPQPPAFESDQGPPGTEGSPSNSRRMVHGSLNMLQQLGAYASPANDVQVDIARKSERHLAKISAGIDKLTAASPHNNISGVRF
ncbi:MAG TPA: hypothetical protein VMU04_14120 [Candidatus Acidoferrum sp.]|nr:hypothetical protein [Candidatus Acidoferrum sp.]